MFRMAGQSGQVDFSKTLRGISTSNANRVPKNSGPEIKCAEQFGNRSSDPENSDTFRSPCILKFFLYQFLPGQM